MGFLKKVAKGVAKVASAPVQIATKTTDSVLKKTNLDESINKSLGIDLLNLNEQTRKVTKLEASTSSDEFKRAGFDAVKIGATAMGGAGAITATQAGGALLLTSKIQSGQGVNLGDLASLGGFDTTFAGIDWGGTNIVKPKPTPNPVNNSMPSMDSYFSDTPNYSLTTSSPNETMIVLGVIGFVLLIVIVLIIKK